MKRTRGRTITEEDREAARRLKAIWLAIPADRRPTQASLADRWDVGGEANQSLISQYINARIALNYRAVLFFARELGCQPEDIRTDLPEQQADRPTVPDARHSSQPARLDPVMLSEALKVLDYDEEIGGEYGPLDRAQRLIDVYDHVAANGGTPTMAFIGKTTKEAEQRKDAKTRGKQHERGAKR